MLPADNNRGMSPLTAANFLFSGGPFATGVRSIRAQAERELGRRPQTMAPGCMPTSMVLLYTFAACIICTFP
uniref:Uncharacterized protein n=1 Tax=Bionectria ochroleuca TaxID=29856 RepID=A0A0B7JW76_BIOOC